MDYLHLSKSILIFFLIQFLSPKIISTVQATHLTRVHIRFSGPLMEWRLPKCNNTSTYNDSSLYQSNLNVILSWIKSSLNIVHGSYEGSSGGGGEDTANAIGLCRGDTNSSTCLSCLTEAANKLPQQCPNQKDAVAYFDGCMLRYSNQSIFNKMVTEPNECLTSGTTYSDFKLLNQTQAVLLQRLKMEALSTTGSSSSSVPYFAMGEANGTRSNLTLYAMVQCTPDLSKSGCSDCIDEAIQLLVSSECSEGLTGGRMLFPSCNVRYETADFFYSQPSPPPAPAPTHNNLPTVPKFTEKKSKNTKYILAAVFPAIALVAFFVFLCYFLRRRKSHLRIPVQQGEGDISTVESLQYDFGAIKEATDNFSNDNRLGQGGFGAVYKGKLRDGKEIAVKRLASNNSGQGEAEFKNEIMLLVKLQHRNLVRLFGFCLAKEERLLIYEFVPNASLDHFLFDPKRREYLDWEKRTKIVNGIARGLLYLHEDSRLRIIHRDLKAGNILLDEDMNPKIADFGLAKLFVADQTHADTSRIAGTYGYMAPEYVMGGLISVKADVYSFGILLLEIMCGRRNRDVGENTISLTSLIWTTWREGTIVSMVDPTLLARDSSIGEEITRYIHIGLLCVQENEIERPTMSMVVLMLSTDSLSLPLPTNPGFVSNTVPLHHNQPYSTSTATSTDSFTDLIPR